MDDCAFADLSELCFLRAQRCEEWIKGDNGARIFCQAVSISVLSRATLQAVRTLEVVDHVRNDRFDRVNDINLKRSALRVYGTEGRFKFLLHNFQKLLVPGLLLDILRLPVPIMSAESGKGSLVGS